MTPAELKALCILIMCADPTPLDPRSDTKIRDFADRQAQILGYTDWVAAYHEIP